LTFRVVEFLSDYYTFQKTVLFIVKTVKKSTPHKYSILIYDMKISEIPTHLLMLISSRFIRTTLHCDRNSGVNGGILCVNKEES
jgi:hypothetical protein